MLYPLNCNIYGVTFNFDRRPMDDEIFLKYIGTIIEREKQIRCSFYLTSEDYKKVFKDDLVDCRF